MEIKTTTTIIIIIMMVGWMDGCRLLPYVDEHMQTGWSTHTHTLPTHPFDIMIHTLDTQGEKCRTQRIELVTPERVEGEGRGRTH